MVTEVPADLSWESRSVAFIQPVLVVGHESSVGEDEYVRVGVDPAKMFGRKAGGSRYVAVRPPHRSNWRRAGCYGVANFGSILDKSGHRSAMGGQIWRDYLYRASSNGRRTQRQSSGFPHRPWTSTAPP